MLFIAEIGDCHHREGVERADDILTNSGATFRECLFFEVWLWSVHICLSYDLKNKKAMLSQR